MMGLTGATAGDERACTPDVGGSVRASPHGGVASVTVQAVQTSECVLVFGSDWFGVIRSRSAMSRAMAGIKSWRLHSIADTKKGMHCKKWIEEQRPHLMAWLIHTKSLATFRSRKRFAGTDATPPCGGEARTLPPTAGRIIVQVEILHPSYDLAKEQSNMWSAIQIFDLAHRIVLVSWVSYKSIINDLVSDSVGYASDFI
ncbi:hypothetical protein C8J57DRAFT_1212435 [Mycena rebaudengoi]|nr:hypothetical protein C8J57DRAFT_1212435 [Mycena rebaudengoi]